MQDLEKNDRQFAAHWFMNSTPSFGNSGASPDFACYIQHPFRIIESEHFLFRNHNIDPPITH